MVYCIQKKYANAIKKFKTAVEKEPKLWFSHTGLGWGYLLNGDVDSAVRELELAYVLSKDEYQNCGNLGLARILQSRSPEARQLWRQALDVINKRPTLTLKDKLSQAFYSVLVGEIEPGLEIMKKLLDDPQLAQVIGIVDMILLDAELIAGLLDAELIASSPKKPYAIEELIKLLRTAKDRYHHTKQSMTSKYF